MTGGEREDLQRARLARQRHADALLSRHGVVSVGVGTGADGRPAVVVGVAGVRAADAGLPDDLDGVPVVVREAGRPRAQGD